jgi:hypothetical protein
MVDVSQVLSNRAVGCVTSQKVFQADSTSGRYNLFGVISYSKGFESGTSLIRPY